MVATNVFVFLVTLLDFATASHWWLAEPDGTIDGGAYWSHMDANNAKGVAPYINRQNPLGFYFSTFRSRVYGSQSWPAAPIVGQIKVIDCLGYGCRAGCSQQVAWLCPASGRRLGHGGGASLVPVPMPDSTKSASDAGWNACDLSTVIDGANFVNTNFIGLLSITWYFTCVIKPGSGANMGTMANTNLKAVLLTVGNSIELYPTWAGAAFDSNPLPNIPVLWCTSTSTVSPGKWNDDRVQKYDEHVITGGIWGSMNNFSGFENVVLTVYASVTDDEAEIYEENNSGASLAFLYIYGDRKSVV